MVNIIYKEMEWNSELAQQPLINIFKDSGEIKSVVILLS